MVELTAQRGYAGVTVRNVSRLAGVSTRTFYSHFPNAEECFASTYESLMLCALHRARAAQQQARSWEEGLRAVLRSLMDDVAAHPKEARLILFEAFAVGPGMRRRMRETVASFEQLPFEGLPIPSGQLPPSARLGVGMAAGVTRVARTSFLDGDLEGLPGIADEELGDWALSLLTADAAGADAPERASQPGSQDARLLAAVGDERARILNAVVKLGLAGGYSELTIPRIRAEAGVSRRNFDARFSDVADCFLEAVEALVLAAGLRAEQVAAEVDDWSIAMRRKVAALATDGARWPRLANLVFVEVLAPGLRGLQLLDHLLSIGADRLRAAAPAGSRPGTVPAEASLAAAWGIAQDDVAAGRARELPRLAPLLGHVLVAAAAKEVERTS
jgi:AcrR family transcriptional regulator